MRTSIAALTLTLLCPLLSQGQTYDLRASGNKDPVTGDKVQQEETERQLMNIVTLQNGQVMQKQEQEQGLEQTFLEEFNEVDAEGEVVQVTRTYSRFVDLESKESLDGELVVVVSRDAEGKYSHDLAEGAVVPALLRTKVDGYVAKKNGDEDENKKEPQEVFAPEEPVAVGATWSVDPAEAVAGMGIEDEVDLANSSVKGTLVSAEQEGEHTFLTIEVELNLKMLTMGGNPFPEPLDWQMKMTIKQPDGGGQVGELHMEGTIVGSFAPPGAPAGLKVDLDMKLSGDMTRRLP